MLAVAIAVIAVAALWLAPPGRPDEVPPATTPATTTPDAPPPDPYHPPQSQSKPAPPKRAAPVAPVARSGSPVRVAPTRSYSPLPTAPAAPKPSAPARKAIRPRVKKAVHKTKRHAVQRPAEPKRVKMTFNPFARFVASDESFVTAGGGDDRGRYLWFAGFAFTLLAAAGLSLQLVSIRALGVK
ncbi:MAG: hypothetical protein ACJ74D_01800 [Gaiellaceae bacterium]